MAAALCGLAAVALVLATTVLGGGAREGYSQTAQFISELGERGSPNGGLVSAAGFAPIGLLVLAFLVLVAPQLPRTRGSAAGLWCFGAVGASYLVSAVARCDPGCPADGSFTQSVHNLFGGLEYVGACAGLLLFAGAFRSSDRWRPLWPVCVLCAALVGLGFAGVLAPSLAEIRGASQRIAEAGIFGFVALAAQVLLFRPAAPRSP
jgi:hypothetical protein